jgi:hypothetical protein
MGDIIPFPSSRRNRSRENAKAQPRPPETVFHDRGWRILQLPSAGRFVAVSDYCRRGVEVGRFDPRAGCDNHHDETDIAILTRCSTDERLARCAIGWLNSDGPRTAILGAFVVAAGGRYRYWRDAVIEVAAAPGSRVCPTAASQLPESPSPCRSSICSRRLGKIGAEPPLIDCRAKRAPPFCDGLIQEDSFAIRRTGRGLAERLNPLAPAATLPCFAGLHPQRPRRNLASRWRSAHTGLNAAPLAGSHSRRNARCPAAAVRSSRVYRRRRLSRAQIAPRPA